jgi:serine protease DegQ
MSRRPRDGAVTGDGQRRGPGPSRVASVALVTGLALAACTADTSADGRAAAEPSPAPATSSARTAEAAGASADIPDIVDRVQPSVVTVLTDSGSGSGVVYDDEGTVITNEHVVRGAEQVRLAFADGEQRPARVVAVDPVVDLAVLETDRIDLPPAEFDTALPQVGALAVVIGSPLGFEQTVTAGIISGLHRSIPGSARTTASLVDLIQTDAPISPGNSGGALVDADGEVVGISEAYIPPAAGAVDIGFAIPAATVVDVVEELRADGRADHAFLGLQPSTLTPQTAGRLGVSVDGGVVVLAVTPKGPAARSGVEPGDVITELDGQELTSAEALLAALRDVEPGDTLELNVVRDGEERRVRVTAAARPR